jgi:hypothetical protein
MVIFGGWRLFDGLVFPDNKYLKLRDNAPRHWNAGRSSGH